MKLGMIGLGKMGANMTKRLIAGGHEVVVTDISPDAVADVVAYGAQGAHDVAEVVAQLPTPRILWLMLPAGDVTETTLITLADVLSQGDIIIDGGNSNYKDTQRRAQKLSQQGLHLVDVGTSGGVWGLTEGYSLMMGGDESIVKHLAPIFETLAPSPQTGWGYVGKSGAGHFVKMVHNGIEYGMMQAYAEGFEIMHSKEDLGLDVHHIARIWQHGSVVRSWLLDLTVNALAEDSDLSEVEGWVADSGEGRWTVQEALDNDIPAPIITLSLMARFISRQENSYGAKLLAAMRHQFGGHAIKKVEK